MRLGLVRGPNVERLWEGLRGAVWEGLVDEWD